MLSCYALLIQGVLRALVPPRLPPRVDDRATVREGVARRKGKDCPRCGHRVYHPDWPQEPKQLEKAW
ncbi:unnamed protein product, partial [Ectocarpus sp. 12 AP-2014]